MTNWAKVIDRKIALAKRNMEHGMKPGKFRQMHASPRPIARERFSRT